MSHRLQITLDDEQYADLKRRSEETGASIAALIRRAIDPDQRNRTATIEERLARLQQSAGAWTHRGDDERPLSGEEYVEAIRRR